MALRTISFKLNGRRVSVEAPVTINLLQLLRQHLDITSPKFGCEQGNCGACTVWLDGEPVNSCMVLAATVEGREVTTVEGLGTLEHPHPLQSAITEHYGSQCGYCTPGMIMSAAALLKRNKTPTREDVVEAIVGNVCRCTGYNKIVESVLAAARNGNGRQEDHHDGH
ncbi:MAG TPA: (2Fe-2S)-binding protein [Anaerolineales bacterium]|nr:(2Fe-2S)-binding protein [Anaerolineales bacterium]